LSEAIIFERACYKELVVEQGGVKNLLVFKQLSLDHLIVLASVLSMRNVGCLIRIVSYCNSVMRDVTYKGVGDQVDRRPI